MVSRKDKKDVMRLSWKVEQRVDGRKDSRACILRSFKFVILQVMKGISEHVLHALLSCFVVYRNNNLKGKGELHILNCLEFVSLIEACEVQ